MWRDDFRLAVVSLALDLELEPTSKVRLAPVLGRDVAATVERGDKHRNRGVLRHDVQLNAGALAAVTPALAIASLTIAINLIVDDISAQAGGSLAKKMV